MIEKSLPYEPGVRAPRFPIQVAEFDGRAAPRSVHAFLPKLVDACGLPSFEGLVAQVAKQALDCDHVTGFSFQIDEPPVVVCMSSVDEHNPVRRVSGPYVATHWCNDPTNLFLFEKFKRDNVYLIFMSEDQVPDERYRHDCFTSTGVKHRVSLLKWHERGIIKLSFHRTERAGPFSADAMNEIVPWAEVLASLLIKHDLVRPSPRSGVEAAERYKLSIGIYCPEGRVAKLAIGRVEPIITQLSRFVNLLKSEEAPEQIVLIVDGPLAGKSEAFAQPQHRFEPGDRPARRFE